MSIQISVDPAGLSQEQREAVAGFILAFPGKACAGTCGHSTAEIHVNVEATNPTAIAGAVVNELEALQHDHESTMPEAAFGKPDEAAAAFGVPAAPLVGSTPVIAGASTVAPPPPANTAPTTTTPGVASSAAGASSGGVDFSAALQADAQKLAAMGQSGAAGLPNGVELDKHGLPWDGRIHAGTKRKNADGSWTAKRGVDPALVATVEAELRQVMGAAPAPLAQAPVASTAPSVPTPPPATAAPVTANLPTASVSPAVAPQPPAPPAPVVGGEVPADARQQFVGLVGRASAAIQGQKVTQAEVNQICADSGIPALPLLANRLDLVATVASRIDALIAARSQ